MSKWNPAQYLKFSTERTRPSYDLVARIFNTSPANILDVGCGPGNSTSVLTERYPKAKVTGIDSSKEMIEQAKKNYPGGNWICADAQTYDYKSKYDIIYSNAALQWIPDQKSLIHNLISLLTSRGVLAAQVPGNRLSPLHQATITTAEQIWPEETCGCAELIHYHEPDFFYDIFCQYDFKIDIWTTTYQHVFSSCNDIIEWYKSTGMKPFLHALPNDQTRQQFMEAVYSKIVDHYPQRKDGKVIFPFRRIFFTAEKGN